MKRFANIMTQASALLAIMSSVDVAGAAPAHWLDESEFALYCVEENPDNGRGQLRVEVAEDGGRLVASVFAGLDANARLLKRAGVAERPSGGRFYDLMYVGKDLKISLQSDTGLGLLEYGPSGRVTRAELICD